MEEFVQALKASIPGPFNVLLRRQAAQLEVPPMDLQMVSIRSAFELAVPEQGTWVKIQPDGSQIQFFREFKTVGGNDRASAPVYIIDAYEQLMNSNPFKGVRAGPLPKIEIHSVQDVIRDDADVQKLLTAIDAALELAQNDQVAEVKYHPDTSLLIVRAVPEQLSTIQAVIDQFRESNTISENERVTQALRLSELRAELIERRATLERAEATLNLRHQELQELQRLRDEQRVSSYQILEAETNLRLAQSDMQAARARYEVTLETIEALKHATDHATTETRRYRLRLPSAGSRVMIKVLQEIASTSNHIRSVEGVRDDQSGAWSVDIKADQKGHRLMTMLIEGAMGIDVSWRAGTPQMTTGGWKWVKDFWGQEFHDSLVP
jgi:hypothetical protein